MTRWHVALVYAGVALACGSSWWSGRVYETARMRGILNDMASEPTNTFTKCLVEGWEQSGAFGSMPERRWVLEPNTERQTP
ncbi:hypothetical protein [Microcystis phage vB_MweS-yong2]|nr:hypothetical protein [Microcystis phage vB_MweS-yong2]